MLELVICIFLIGGMSDWDLNFLFLAGVFAVIRAILYSQKVVKKD